MWHSTGNNNVTLSLFSGSLYGTALWSQTFINPLGDYGSALSINNLNGPMLNAGSSYWLSAASDSTSEQVWDQNNTGAVSSVAVDDYGEGYYVYNPDVTLAMLVEANDVTPTPIPATLPLFGSGLVGLVGLRKRLLEK
jgi:hypothetical protein